MHYYNCNNYCPCPVPDENYTVIQGTAGPQGIPGPQGIAGESPKISVVEDTLTSYKVSFKTTDQEVVSPNFRSNIKYYNVH